MTTPSLPPNYVTTPAWVIESAFSVTPPKRALLGSYNRLLALAWNRDDRTTPTIPESFFYDNAERQGYLRVSRRQFYEVVSEMEGMRWLRSARPRAGFVQFVFHGSDPSAENRTDGAKNRTELLRNEEEEILLNLNTDSSSSFNPLVRKIAPVQKIALESAGDSQQMLALVEHLPMLFDPETFGGPLEMREVWLGGIPSYAVAWIAKAYKERQNLTKGGGALGLIVNGLNSLNAPHRYYVDRYTDILPEAYLEAVGMVQFECDHCKETFGTRQEKNEHMNETHFPCADCGAHFSSREEYLAHYDQKHNIMTRRLETPVHATVEAPSGEPDEWNGEQVWQNVLATLQDEMPRASFDTWVSSSRMVRTHDKTFVVGARNSYAREWLDNRLTERVVKLLEPHGFTAVEFVVAQFVAAEAE